MFIEPSSPTRSLAGRPSIRLVVQPIHAAGLALLRAAGVEPRAATGLTLAREAADCVAVITRNGVWSRHLVERV